MLAFSDNGACTKQAESFFSRLRRMVGAQNHKVSGHYLHQYAANAAWLQDHRRLDNGALAHRALGLGACSWRVEELEGVLAAWPRWCGL